NRHRSFYAITSVPVADFGSSMVLVQARKNAGRTSTKPNKNLIFVIILFFPKKRVCIANSHTELGEQDKALRSKVENKNRKINVLSAIFRFTVKSRFQQKES
ncbi:MAG: hypothetical protein K2M50_00210, partial [Treponemataceae bacterium]|nr:hypothetical protein [Treponemataceae bacterium]